MSAGEMRNVNFINYECLKKVLKDFLICFRIECDYLNSKEKGLCN